MNTNEKFTGRRLDTGETVTGELFTWDKFPITAIICEDHHERISQGHRVDPFSIQKAAKQGPGATKVKYQPG